MSKHTDVDWYMEEPRNKEEQELACRHCLYPAQGRDGMKIGDVVRLKSGGPWMTVTGVAENAGVVDCVWFVEANDNFYRDCGAFPGSALEHAEEEKGGENG